MNYLDRLPLELQFYISEFIPSKSDYVIPYLNEFKSVVTDWYNRTRVWGDHKSLSYDELYLQGIVSHETQYIKYRFFTYAKEKKYYKMIFSSEIKQFKKMPFCTHHL